MNQNLVEKLFHSLPLNVDFCSLRFEEENAETLSVRQNEPAPPTLLERRGFMITVHHKGGTGYAASSDISETGFKNAFAQAKKWAEFSSAKSVTDFSKLQMPNSKIEYSSAVKIPWESITLKEKFELLQNISQNLKISDKIVDWMAALWYSNRKIMYLTNHGGKTLHNLSVIAPYLMIVAHDQGETISRSSKFDYSTQGGYEILDQIKFDQFGPQLAQECVDLLAAPTCPTAQMDLLLAPDQMMLQIHESIGHPLELDRILGDERNYAGTSFVTKDMFGNYQYGSELLNISYDPSINNQLASFGADDDGLSAQKVMLIENGILKKPLGGIISQQRAGLSGVANSRSASWHRPTMDRMANLNLEPGTSSFNDMVGSIEKGIYMQTNNSWSIDDSRNKFQFGCEYGRLIENGKLTTLVKKPNYRGISESFWRSLKMVGNQDTFKVYGTMYCGKGEPNQAITVGHASPACLFANIDVFGGV